MTTQINFILHGDESHKGTATSCLAQEPITLNDIRRIFPFEGVFHFRVKRKAKDFPVSEVTGGHVWFDISDENEAIWSVNGIIDIQALVICLPNDGEGGDCAQGDGNTEYMQEVERVLCETRLDHENRPDRRSIQAATVSGEVDPITLAATTALDIAKGIHNISLDSVTKNAASLWSSVKSTASHFGVQLLTPADNLGKLHSLLSTSFDDSVHKHVLLLEDLWQALFPGYPFERESPKWREAGWQKPDPVVDLKSTGILALRTMRYLGETYPTETQRMLRTQKENIKTHYPFAVVGINLTLLLCEILGIREKKYQQSEKISSGYYDMFQDKKAFYELFCICFFYLDHIWVERNSVRADFGKLIGEIKEKVVAVMEKRPQNLDQFKSISVEENFYLVY